MKKLYMIMCVVVAATMMLTACGGSATQASGGATKAPAGQKVNLVYWSMWNKTEPSAIAMTDIIQKFEAANPNITITVVWNGRDNQTKVRTALGAGTKIDIADQDANQIAGGLMQEDMLLPLDDMFNSPDLSSPSTTFKDVFLPGLVDMFAKNGVHYLMPYDDSPVMFWYSKDVFAKAGITALPATWDDFLTDLQKIKDAGFVPIAVDSDGGDYNEWYIQYLVERFKGKGFLLSAVEDKTGQMWNDPVFTQAFTMVQNLWDKGYISPASKGYLYPAGQQTIATGKAGMELCGGWLPDELSPVSGPKFNWGALSFPSVTGGVGKNTDLFEWLLAFGILKSTAHPQEAEAFLKFVMTQDSQTRMTQALRGVVRKGVPWPAAMADGYTASTNATTVLDEIDGANVLYPDFATNVFAADVIPVFLGQATIASFPARISADAKNYWASH